MIKDAKARAEQEWFGYGRWNAPYWFIGMEPGGRDHPELYTAWEAAGGSALVDAARHEDEWNRLVPPHLQMRHFWQKPVIQRTTWQPLIHIVLGFTRSADDPHLYQRDRLGRLCGDTALIEISPIASQKLSESLKDSSVLQGRIKVIRQELVANPVTFAVCYGTRYRKRYEELAGGPFDTEGFRWSGNTLCALITHPSRPTKKYSYWFAYGKRLREVIDRQSRDA